MQETYESTGVTATATTKNENLTQPCSAKMEITDTDA